jgi:exonuclease SbcC
LNEHVHRFKRILIEQKEILERSFVNAERDQREQKSQHEHAIKSLSQNAEQIKVLSEVLLNKSKNEYQLFIGGVITRSKQKNDELSGKITAIEKVQVTSESDIASLVAEQSKLRVRKDDQVRLDEPFIVLQRYLESLAVSIDDSSIDGSESALKEFLGKQEANWSDKLEVQKLKRTELEKQIASLKERCAVEDRAASVDDLSAKRRGIIEQIGMLNQEVSSFQVLMKKMDRPIPEDSLQWTCCKEVIERYINQQIDGTAKMSKAQAAMRSIQKISEMAVEFRDPQMLQGQLNELTTQLKAHKLIIDALQKDVEKISTYIRETTDVYFRTDLINQLYTAIDPHPEFKRIKFECNMDGDRPQLRIFAVDSEAIDQVCPTLTFSSAQINVLALSIFLAQALTTKDDNREDVDCIFIDDPVQSVDSINSLSFIDLMRTICLVFDKQIIVSTHDENFHELLKKKIPPGVLPAKYLKLASFGQVVDD